MTMYNLNVCGKIFEATSNLIGWARWGLPFPEPQMGLRRAEDRRRVSGSPLRERMLPWRSRPTGSAEAEPKP